MSVEAPWMWTALREIGVTETPGPRSTPRILTYHGATALAASDDAVPWCASYCGWVLREAGVTPTGSAAARSYATWGVTSDPRYGAVAVLSRGRPPRGHVGFLIDADDEFVWILGGNQGDRVSVAPFPMTRLVACRWPGQGGPP